MFNRQYIKVRTEIINHFANGGKIQLNKGTEQFPKWVDCDVYDPHISFYLYRKTPEIEIQLVSVELPPIFWIKFKTAGSKEDYFELCTSRYADGYLETAKNAGRIEDFYKQGSEWSSDLKTWYSFMEEKPV